MTVPERQMYTTLNRIFKKNFNSSVNVNLQRTNLESFSKKSFFSFHPVLV